MELKVLHIEKTSPSVTSTSGKNRGDLVNLVMTTCEFHSIITFVSPWDLARWTAIWMALHSATSEGQNARTLIIAEKATFPAESSRATTPRPIHPYSWILAFVFGLSTSVGGAHQPYKLPTLRFPTINAHQRDSMYYIIFKKLNNFLIRVDKTLINKYATRS